MRTPNEPIVYADELDDEDAETLESFRSLQVVDPQETTKDFGPFFTARIEDKDSPQNWMRIHPQRLVSSGYAGETVHPYRNGRGIAFRRPYGALVIGVWYSRGIRDGSGLSRVQKRQLKRWRKEPLAHDHTPSV